jgi:hypothetical protein
MARNGVLHSTHLTAAVDLANAEKAVSTRKAYGTDFRLFKAWCEVKGVSPLPASPETVAAFLAAETGEGTKPATLARRIAAIRYAHKLAHLDTPTDSEAVKATLRGIRRTVGAAKVRKAPHLLALRDIYCSAQKSVAIGCEADIDGEASISDNDANDPSRTSLGIKAHAQDWHYEKLFLQSAPTS